MRSRLTTLALATLAAGALADRAEQPAAKARPETPAEIDACVRAPLEYGTSVQTVTFRSRDRQGNESRFEARIYWKRFEDGLSRALMRVTDPPDNRGTALLLIQKADRNDIFMYLPELKRVRRVTTRMVSSSVLGTDFSYEDFQRLQGLSRDGRVERLPDEALDGRAVYVLDATPEADPESGSIYGRVRSYVDQESCVPLKVEYFEHGDEPRKVLTTRPEDIVLEGGLHLPRKLSMTDRRERTSTELVLHEIELGVPLRKTLFNTRQLEFGKE